MDDLRRRFTRLLHGNGKGDYLEGEPIEQDVTPYEMRIVNVKHDLYELHAAASAGELNDWAVEQLGTIAETAVNAWRDAVHQMVGRFVNDDTND